MIRSSFPGQGSAERITSESSGFLVEKILEIPHPGEHYAAMSDEKCSVPGCNKPAAVEARLPKADGSMSEEPDHKRRFLCAHHLREDTPKRLYHLL